MDHSLPVVFTVKAVYAYMARESGDLTLTKGDIVKVHDNDGGWWKGTLVHNNTYGSFPSNFVERISPTDSNKDVQEGTLSPIRPLSRQQHTRQSSTETRFAKRKPVNTEDGKGATTPNTPTTKSPHPGSNNASNVSVSNATPQMERRKSPQAILPDSNFEDRSSTGATSTTTPQFQRLAPRFGPRKNSDDSQRSAKSRIGQTPITNKTSDPKGKRDDVSKEPSITTNPSFPGAYPSESPTQKSPVEVTNQTVYNPNYSEQRKHQKQSTEGTTSGLLNPSGPSNVPTGSDRQLNNRYSMPNLADGLHQKGTLVTIQQGDRLPAPTSSLTPGQMYPQGSAVVGPRTSGTQSACNLPNGTRVPELDEFGLPKADQAHSRHGHNNSEGASQHFQPGMMPRSETEYHSQSFVGSQMPVHSFHAGCASTNNSYSSGQLYLQQQQQQLHIQQQQLQRGHRHSIANIQPFQQNPPIGKSQLSLENLANHNRSQSALEAPKPGPSHTVHGRSKSQVNLRPEGSAVFNPYDHQSYIQQQQYQPIQQQGYAPMRTLSPSIVIPPPQPRPPSNSHFNPGMSPDESVSSAISPTAHRPYLYSPDTPTSASTVTSVLGDLASPTSAGTSMSRASVLSGGLREQRRKNEAMVRPKHTPSTFSTRRFSGDTKQLLASVTTTTVSAIPSATLLTSTWSMDPDTADIDMSAYMAKKPKTTLIRAFKQILNPKKVAEKDAIKNKNDHFAWVEMQKSLKRVSSPEPTLDNPFFTTPIATGANANTGCVGVDEYSHQDPFEVLKRSHVMRDAAPTGNSLDFGPSAFVQVDKVARNINQRGSHMTPQLLSQKYLTRPYSKSPLFKLRVLFVWVSENIRLEGGPMRDVSGGRYKLGPAGDHLAAVAAAQAIGGTASAVNSPSSRPESLVPPAAVFMAGIEEYSRGFLQEDTPELAQDVLTSRTCKTGEGFANLFAEMALAAGIEDVGVVKGYIRGPMDVFSKDVPPPNHAWNVVRIDGTYRFIDCCLASPYHPAHYPNRPSGVLPFYFLTSPMDLVLSHFPTFLTYQYIAPAIPPQVFVRLPFVRPAFFDYGLNLVDFKQRTRLEIKDDQPIEVVIRIDGRGNGQATGTGSVGGALTGGVPMTSVQGLFGGDCLGKGCGEGIELRAEVEAMTSEGKVVRKRGLAQIMIWNPYHQGTSSGLATPPAMGTPALGVPSGYALTTNNTAATMSRLYQGHHCTGVRIAKIKAVLPAETVMGSNGVRKGVVHIYAGRKVENAPIDATPYSLALSLPITHTGTMSKTPFNFVHPHFSPYEFYVKAPQSELLYYPHTYSFCVVSLVAQAQGAAASAIVMTEAEMLGSSSPSSASITTTNNNNNNNTSPASSLSPRHTKSASMAPLPLYRGLPSITTPSLRNPSQTPVMSTSVSSTSYRNGGGGGHPYQHQQYSSTESTSSLSMGGGTSASPSSMTLSSIANGHNGQGVPRPERLVLRTQTNRIYKLAYDPLRQCHEAKVEIKERGIWECVRMDDGGKSRVGREGTGGVVIASWKCV